MADVFYREGAMIMSIAFFFAPIGGLLLGLAAAIAAYRLMSPRTAEEQERN
jgi:hypothetical protein